MMDDICRIAAAAGRVVLTHYRRPMSITAKADDSPLTDADRASHGFLVEALGCLAPGWPVVSEESADESRSDDVTAGTYWLVDPLVGTKEFLKGTGEFTVNIALVEQGRPVLGVVMAPALALTYCGSRAEGAWRRRGDGPPARIHTRPTDRERVAIVASKDHAGPMVSRLLARAARADFKSVGSSLKFCLVAEGEADVYLRDLPTMEWDTAAAQCVVEAAGGVVRGLDGRPLQYGKTGLRNPPIVTLGDAGFAWERLLEEEEPPGAIRASLAR
jgi:3'(2'), 5'-bisphosphate nucleotidase